MKRFLGEGGKKKVYLAHDGLLDRDVAFALIKTDGLDDIGRERVRREAQAMGRMGTHPHIVAVFDLGEHDGQPYMVTELMGGGDVEGLLENAPDHRLPLDHALRIADEVCRGLEFAHEQLLVHRDLKPGNVWLTGDGAAKIGDFGLAVATDRARLTQAGLMVGTVSYMPPEQATGGATSPRADLYSLGAMLYEMVTGRPPFIGDDSVAIIGQHLNTPPVAPTWHRPECPPALETLILRLLEKDPGKRPASATEVRAALNPAGPLAAATPVPGDATMSKDGRAVASPLYRRIFVGREPEIQKLHAAFDAALGGQGSLAMVVGEPGIGKTALCEQLATYVALRGGLTLVGHSYEEGSLSLPYLPFIEALRSYVLAREPAGLQEDLGSGAAEVARLVSEIRDRVPVEAPPPSTDPDDDRWRLYQALATFLQNACRVQPLLIILEDLHWADRGTLDLLVYLARQLTGTRLLLVGNYRDIEVDRNHPLSGVLADLRRSAAFQRLPLRGLTADEVQRMLATITGQPVAWSIAEAVHRQTEGNPLFVQEVLRYLAEEGLAHGDHGPTPRGLSGTLELQIPEGLRDVIGKRLSRLSPDCNRVLTLAAVIGRDFSLLTLGAVAEGSEEELLRALEEAVRVGVLEDQSRAGQVRFRFAHAFFRQTLYEEIFTPRRLRLHQQVGRALEAQYAARLEEHAAELAEHFSQSSDADDLRKAVQYAELAAHRATAVHAYGEAARHLERALAAQEVLDPDDLARRCDLLLALGDALGPAGEPRRVFEDVADNAVALAETIGDHERAAHACSTALLALVRFGGGTLFGDSSFRRWAERADRHAPSDGPDRVQAELALGRVYQAQGAVARAATHLRNALGVARRVADPAVLIAATSGYLGSSILTWRVNDVLALPSIARDVLPWVPDQARSGRHGGLHWCALALLAGGDRVAAESLGQALSTVVERTQDPQAQVSLLDLQSVWALLNGDLAEVVRLAEHLREVGPELGSPASARQSAQRAGATALLHLGRTAEGLLWMDEWLALASTTPPHWRARRDLYATQAGVDAGAAGRLRVMLGEMQRSAAEDRSAVVLILLLQATVVLGDAAAAREILPQLEPLAGVPMLVGTNLVAVGRVLGEGAALVGDRVGARAFYQAAIDATRRIRYRPELALTRLDLAELLLTGDPAEQQEAQEHLDFAIAEFRAMKMQPALERALSHKGLLHA